MQYILDIEVLCRYSYPHIFYFLPVSAFTDACTAAHVLSTGNFFFLKFRKRKNSHVGNPKLCLRWSCHLLHMFWILSLGPGFLKAEVHCLLFRKTVLCLNTDICLRVVCWDYYRLQTLSYRAWNSRDSRAARNASLWLSGTLTFFLRPCWGAEALQLIWGCQESDWGKRKIVYVRFLHRREVRWRRLIAARNYNGGLFHRRARYWCVLEESQLLCQLADSEFKKWTLLCRASYARETGLHTPLKINFKPGDEASE